jgi:hypothetical protein
MAERRMTSRRWAIACAVVVLAAVVLASGVIAGQFRAADPEAFQAALATGEIMRVAEIPAGDGLGGRGVFAQTTDTGQLCVWDAPSASSRERQGGCNPMDDPLGGSAVSASLAYDGGPAIESVRDARMSGLAASGVASVAVLMSDGSERAVRLKTTSLDSGDFVAFGYRFKKVDLGKGVGPVAVIARGADGTELARQPTGIGG